MADGGMLGTDHEAAEIARLGEVVARQKRAHLKDPNPSAAVRRERLETIIAMVAANRMRMREALTADYGSHPVLMSDLVEVNGSIARVRQALDNLDAWMAPEPRPVDAGFGEGRAWMTHQPKGVVGNIVPWNFPFEIGLGPVAEMVAAGNRVVIKPSEVTPACAQVLREMVASAFDEEVMTTVLGGPAVAKAFAATPFDHLLFTGGTEVGRQVMRAAAKNLTPVTLELGGKSPIVIAPGGLDERAVRSIVGLKLIKSGQVCVSADHVFTPRGDVARFVELAQAYVRTATPGHSQSDDVTGIVAPRHFDRLQALLDDARAHGGDLVVLEGETPADPAKRRMPLTLVLGATSEMRLAKEEVFGPILPVFAYDDVDEVVERLAGEGKPLTMTIFGHDQAVIDRLVSFTISGGVSVNGASLHTAVISLGFGGVGASGMGRHHGIEGFREFSSPRAMFVRGPEDHAEIIFPPYGEAAAGAVAALFPEPAATAEPQRAS